MNPEGQAGARSTPRPSSSSRWPGPDSHPDDIDLYVEVRSATSSGITTADAASAARRDDRGGLNNSLTVAGRSILSPIREETVSIRGIVGGRIHVNIQYLSRLPARPGSITVKVEKINPVVEVIHYDKIILDHAGQERTAVRFRIAQDGKVTDTIMWRNLLSS